MTNTNFQTFQDSFFGEHEGANRFKLHDLYVENFWYYDSEHFPIESGSIFFRGRNGSGKSIITSMLLPLLIDGDTSPNRIDPFGSSTRTFSSMVLGEEHIGGRTNETGYIGVCYRQGGTGEMVYCGIGAHATKTGLTKWYFVSEGINPFDANSEFRVFDDKLVGSEVVRTYADRGTLKKRAQGNKKVFFMDRQDEYARLVNDKIFGFTSQEEFQRYIKLLIQIKNPKVVDNNFVKEIGNILRQSFPTLSSKSIDALNASIETLDKKENDLNDLQMKRKALRAINSKFADYRNKVLADLSIAYKNKFDEAEKLIHDIEKTKKDLVKTENGIERLSARLEQINEEIDMYTKRKMDLDDHDSMKIRKQIEILTNEKNKHTNELNQFKNELNRTILSLDKLNGSLNTCRTDLLEKTSSIRSILQKLSNETSFESIHLGFDFIDDALRNFESSEFSFSAWEDAIAVYKKTLKEIQQKEKDIFTKTFEVSKQKELLESLRIEIETNQIDLNRFNEDFATAIEHAITDISDLFQFTDEPLMKIAELIDELEEHEEFGFDYSSSQKTLLNIISELETPIRLELLDLQRSIDNHKKEIAQIKKDIEALRKDDGPRPILTKAEEMNLKTFKEQGNAFKFFYELVDFKEGVSAKEQYRIERFLYENHYLFAAFSEQTLPNDVYTIKHKQYDKNISSVLKPIASLEGKYQINKILASVPFGNDIQSFDNDRSEYVSTSVVYGETIKLGFIGEENRRIRKQEEIERLETKIVDIEMEIDEISVDIGFREEDLLNLNNDKETVLTILKSVSDVHENVKETKRKINNLEERKTKETSKLITLENVIEPLQQVINTLRSSIKLTHDVSEVEGLIDVLVSNIQTLKQLLFERKSLLMTIEKDGERLAAETLVKKETETKITSKESDIAMRTRAIEDLQHQLSLTNEDEVKKEIEFVVSKLLTLPKENTEKSEERGVLRNKLTNLTNHLERLDETYAIVSPMTNYLFRLASAEFEKKLHDFDFVGGVLTIEEVNKIIAWHNKQEKFTRNKPKTASILFSELSKAFTDHMSALNNYNPSLPLVDTTIETDLDTSDIEQFMRSYSFELKEREVVISSYELEKRIEHQYDELSRMITEQESEMINNYLINDIDSEIKRRVDEIELFIRRLNENMSHVKTSVQIKIDWTPIQSKETKYGVADVIKLIGNSITRSEEETEIVRTFYKDKIELVKTLHRKEGDTELKQLLESELDYRTWFDFKILFRQSRDHKFQELTSRLFASKSGGEKGMSTYIPLFSCINITLDNASAIAPRLISMDEAFNRIDEKNIEAMFDLISLYDFDYVMNSEKVWALYDSVKDLNIMEILREVTEKDVTVMKYRWKNKVFQEIV